MSLTQRILIAMGLGLILGALLQWIALPQEHFVNAFVLNGVIAVSYTHLTLPTKQPV